MHSKGRQALSDLHIPPRPAIPPRQGLEPEFRSRSTRAAEDGDKLYDQTLALVMDETEKDAVLEAKAKKYPQQPAVDKSRVYVFKVLPG